MRAYLNLDDAWQRDRLVVEERLGADLHAKQTEEEQSEHTAHDGRSEASGVGS